MLSYWEKKSFFYHRHLIICGAGFTGLSAAVYFKKKYPHKKVLVLEKDTVNGGASTKNAGFACFGSPSELIADIQAFNENNIFHLVEQRYRGLQNMRNLLGDKNIGYEPAHGYELFRKGGTLYDESVQRLNYLNQHLKEITGYEPYQKADKKIGIFGFNGIEHIIENIAEGQVDTGMMYTSLLHLAGETGVDVFNGIMVKRFEETKDVVVHTDDGSISCDQFLVAANGFASQILPDSQTIPARAQALITSPVKNLKVSGSFHMNEGFYYFRNIDGRILLGGGRDMDFENETTTELQLNTKIQDRLEQTVRDIILPGLDFRIEQRWCGIMGVGNEKKVIVRQLSPKTFCAIRLSGMGLALSTLLGKEVAELMG